MRLRRTDASSAGAGLAPRSDSRGGIWSFYTEARSLGAPPARRRSSRRRCARASGNGGGGKKAPLPRGGGAPFLVFGGGGLPVCRGGRSGSLPPAGPPRHGG